DDAADVVVGHPRPARQAEAALEDAGRHRPAAHRAAGESGLEVQRLPRRPGLDVEPLEVEADVVAAGAEAGRVDGDARQPPRRLAPLAARHEADAGHLRQRVAVAAVDGAPPGDALV